MEWDNVVFFRGSFASLNGVSIGSCLQAVKKLHRIYHSCVK